MASQPETVVLIHGLYLHGVALLAQAQRLRRQGFRTVFFNYPSLRRTTADNARNLEQFVTSLDAPVVHYLAHSLGGLIVRHLLANDKGQLPPGRTVTTGTPHQGSQVAHNLKRYHLGLLLGRSGHQALLDPAPDWPAGRELGCIAGNINLGMGRLASRLENAGDGTVSIREAQVSGMDDFIRLPLTHTSMLFAPVVAKQAEAFFRSGKFLH